MSVYVDLKCSRCETQRFDQWSSETGKPHDDGPNPCEGVWERVWTLTRSVEPGTHISEKVVVFESAQEGGHIQYPGRNDIPVPARLKARGYVRRELNVKDLASFEKRHGVMNERRHYDSNGRMD